LSGAGDDLAKAVDCLPLAPEQAAAYIAAPGAGVGFADYLCLHARRGSDSDHVTRGQMPSWNGHSRPIRRCLPQRTTA
jgi:hypothetical protein